MRVLILEDEGLLRDFYADFITSSELNAEVVASTGDGVEAVKLAEELKPDVALIDYTLDGSKIDGFVAFQRIKRKLEDIKVIIVSSTTKGAMPKKFFSAGAYGYLSKDRGRKIFLEAFDKVARGERYIDPDVMESIAVDNGQSAFESLTPRENEVLHYILIGSSSNEIADQMNLSPKTISTYKTRIYGRLYVHTDIELVRLALKEGLIR